MFTLSFLSSRIKINLLLLVLGFILNSFVFSVTAFAQQQKDVSILFDWNSEAKSMQLPDGEDVSCPHFEGAIHLPNYRMLPFYKHNFREKFADKQPEFSLKNLIFEEVPLSQVDNKTMRLFLTKEILLNTQVFHEKNGSQFSVTFLPMRINAITDKIERLIYADLSINYVEHTNFGQKSTTYSYADNSVLSSGNWVKMSVNSNGIYKISYDLLASMGINPSDIDPRDIAIYGNGGGMLPEITDDFRHDDLVENAIFVNGENDGVFNSNDFVLFYAQGTTQWKYNDLKDVYNHTLDIYSGENFYFLTVDRGRGKRVEEAEIIGETPNSTCTSFDDYYFYEVETYNLAQTGRQWYGEVFNVVEEYNFPMSFPELITSEPVTLFTKVAARSYSTSNFYTYINGNREQNISVSRLSDLSPGKTYASLSNALSDIDLNSSSFDLVLKYDKRNYSGAIGWLDYFEFNFRRNLTMFQSQVLFRDQKSSGHDDIVKFELSNASQKTEVWNISNPLEPIAIPTTLDGSTLEFLANGLNTEEYIAFNDSYKSPQFVEVVANQDLHGLEGVDMVIVSYEGFLEQANIVAEFHRQTDGLNVEVLIPQTIYNEFSSGKQDITAIRDFMRMLYLRAEEGEEPGYLMFYGDASYDYRSYLGEKTNFVSTWESEESMNPVNSYASDDFFVLLDDGDGFGGGVGAVSLEGIVDMAVGRFPVSSSQEADIALNKMMQYVDDSESSMNPWRNRVCFVADDEDSNMHIDDSDDLADVIEDGYKDYMVRKIYLDAYQQESTPGGQRYPEAHKAIIDNIEDGLLIVNYMGHGGENGWAHERVLELSDIQNFTNINSMPFFVTATCEFSRFDNPEKLMAGEYVFLNPNGGGIALFTTTRATYGSNNNQLSERFYDHVFERVDGDYLPIGEVIKLAKRDYGSGANGQKFVLLGNPAMRLAYPEKAVKTTAINGKIVDEKADTIQALASVTISGAIMDDSGKTISDFNGEIFVEAYDKKLELSTLGQDPRSAPQSFELWQNKIYKGKGLVQDGEFELSFIVPKDIAYNYGFGKISYYAKDVNKGVDANGYYSNIVVGGITDNPPEDKGAPDVVLYMNDTTFINGGITDQNPVLLAKVFDENGINITGSAIGHDITAVLDNDYANPYILNNYYTTHPNTYKSGDIVFPLSDISEGPHNLEVVVWDIYNNSRKATIDFVVNSSGNLVIENLVTAPNPMKNETKFCFNHNQAGNSMDVTIRIYDLSGRVMKTINSDVNSDGFSEKSITWNGCNDSGKRLSGGVYIYSLDILTSDGMRKQKSSKLIILN